MKAILILVVLTVSILNSYAQCDKKSVLTASKTEYLNAEGEVQRTVDEKSIVEFDSKEIIITPGDDATMRGTVTSVTCDWKTPYKEGKTQLKASMVTPNGETKNFTLTIEGKAEKISFIVAFDDQPDRKISVVVDKFEEKK